MSIFSTLGLSMMNFALPAAPGMDLFTPAVRDGRMAATMDDYWPGSRIS